MVRSISRAWLPAALMSLLACDQSLTVRADGMPLAPGEEREARPSWRLLDGWVATTLVESGEPLGRSPDSARLPSRLESIWFFADEAHEPGSEPRPHGRAERGFLRLDHGDTESWLRIERDTATEWALTASDDDSRDGRSWPAAERASESALDESDEALEPGAAPAGSNLLVGIGSSPTVPTVSDAEGALWFADGGELFYLDTSSKGAKPERMAAAPGGTIVSLAWNADGSSLFLALQEGPDHSSVVVLSRG
jgi:hypothetical protein